jgi:hypothetical protein
MTGNSFKMGAGKKRDAWSIRAQLAKQGLKMADVARSLGLHNSVVEQTVSGRVNNRKVLNFLKQIGISAKALSLPDDLR